MDYLIFINDSAGIEGEVVSAKRLTFADEHGDILVVVSLCLYETIDNLCVIIYVNISVYDIRKSVFMGLLYEIICICVFMYG